MKPRGHAESDSNNVDSKNYLKILTCRMYKNFFKRFFDFAGALMMIILLSPLYVVFGAIIFITMGTPIFFRQKRPGLHEKIFCIMKFRTMTLDTDKDGNLLPDVKRLTPVGKFIRRTSIDEIPQFFNVLKGDMSFIGPRPLLPRYLPYYTAEERKRHDVRPGITGLAQINGRNNLSWDEKFAYDVEYARSVSFLGDLNIAVKTVLKVFKGSDVGVTFSEGFFDVERQKKLDDAKKNARQTEDRRA